MSTPFLVDLLVANQQQLIDEPTYARAIAFAGTDTSKEIRLAPLLVEWGLMSEEDALRITAAADAYCEALNKLAPPREPAIPSAQEDTPADSDPLATLTPSPPTKGLKTPAQDNATDPFTTLHSGQHSKESRKPRDVSPLTTRVEKIARHAEGGLGQVWIASDAELHRRVAVKEIRDKFASDPDCQARFVREAEITGSLEHPGIVPVYGLGQYDSGEPYYAMRFIEGRTLRQAINELFADAHSRHFRDRNWKNNFRRVLNRFIDVCNTIEYAHSRGVLHRDIKPDNIILGAFGETLLVDWGLAKSIDSHRDRAAVHSEVTPADSSLTLSGSTVGTPAYMSPEQATGGRLADVTKLSDIFSLGATLFQLLSGQTVLQDTSEFPDAAIDESLWPKNPNQHNPRIPAPLASICQKAVAYKPEDRYASAAALAEDIENWLADQPVTAHDESLPERVVRSIRQRPTLSASLSVSAVLMILAALVGVYVRGKHQLQLLEESQRREQLAEFHQEQVTSSVESALAAAKAELRNGRFQSALELLQTASDQLANETGMQSLGDRVHSMLDRTQRLLRFQAYSQQAEDLIFRDSSRRSSILMQRGLKSLGVFDQLEWWNALPTEDLEVEQVHRIRERAYRCMFLLGAIRLKETIPAEISVQGILAIRSEQAEASNRAAIVLFDLLDAYRLSQGAELGRKFATERQATLTRLVTGMLSSQPAIEWQPKNDSDLYVVGAALGFMTLSTTEATRKPFEAIWGFQNAEAVSRDMLDQASQLQPDHYWSQLVRAFFEFARGEEDAAWRSYLHTIALDPQNWIGHAWYGYDLREAAVQLPKDDPNRKILLEKSSKHLERAVDLNPTSATAHFKYGDTLTWLMQDPREAVYEYVRGLALQEPLETLLDPMVESNDRFVVESVASWCRNNIKNNWTHEDLYACLAWSALLLGEIEEAGDAAKKALEQDATHEISSWVLARIDTLEGRHESAESRYQLLCEQAPTFHSCYGRAENFLAARNLGNAKIWFQHAFALAVTDWQKLATARRMANIALLQKSNDIMPAIEQAIELAPTERLDDLLETTIEMEQGAGRRLIESHHAALLPIQSLTFPGDPKIPPLINGDFEMGLSVGWGDSLDKYGKPTLERFGGSQVLCITVPKAAHSGELGLDVLNPDSSPADSYAVIEQHVPLVVGQTYRFSCWSRADYTSPEAVEIHINGSKVLSLNDDPEWTESSATFSTDRTDSKVELRFVAPAHFQIDNIHLQRVTDQTNSSAKE